MKTKTATGKIIQLDYDYVQTLSDEKRLICMTEKEAAVLLSLTKFIGWPTRWYPNNSINLDVIASLEASIAEALMSDCSCECLAECLEDPGIRDIIIDIIENDNIGDITKPLPEAILQENLLVGCIDNEIYGACRVVVDGIFDSTLEVLQKINASVTPLKALGELLELAPIVGQIVGVGLTLTTWVTDTALLAFEAVDSAAVRDEFVCQLFCIAKANCAITIEQVFYVFEANAIDTLPNVLSLKSQLEFLAGLVLSGQPNVKIAATINMLGLYIIKYGGKFGSHLMSARSFNQLVAIGQSDYASDDWTILCDTCPTYNIIDFTQIENIFYNGIKYTLEDYYISPTRTYPAAIKTNDSLPPGTIYPAIYNTEYVSDGDKWSGCWVKIHFQTPTTMQNIQFRWYYDITATTANAGIYRSIRFYDVNDVILDTWDASSTLSQSIWRNQFFSGNVANVSYMWVQVRRNSLFASNVAGMYCIDDIAINVGV